MPSPIPILSTKGYDFPDVTVEWEDLLRWPYRVDGRDATGIDCLGVVIEVFRRAGIGVPDPLVLADGIEEFAEYFTLVETLGRFDVVYINRPSHHIGIVVDDAYMLTASEKVGVHRNAINLVRRIPNVQYYSLKTELLSTPS